MAAAHDAYTVALAIAARLATADPANTELAARAEALRQRITLRGSRTRPLVLTWTFTRLAGIRG